jgi:hypothetical protein
MQEYSHSQFTQLEQFEILNKICIAVSSTKFVGTVPTLLLIITNFGKLQKVTGKKVKARAFLHFEKK